MWGGLRGWLARQQLAGMRTLAVAVLGAAAGRRGGLAGWLEVRVTELGMGGWRVRVRWRGVRGQRARVDVTKRSSGGGPRRGGGGGGGGGEGGGGRGRERRVVVPRSAVYVAGGAALW